VQTAIIVGKNFPKIVIPLLNNAKKNIDILVYDWRWYADQIGAEIQKFNTAIIYAARRGVSVRAITKTVDTIKVLKDNGVNAKIWAGGNLMHSKVLLIDNRFLIIGSHNYTMNAFTLNLEASMLIEEENGFPDILNYFKIVWSL
jgi:phosphatidylserine/phosphatidylglycerophosphate/cardiolipin synthase-like enzyme